MWIFFYHHRKTLMLLLGGLYFGRTGVGPPPLGVGGSGVGPFSSDTVNIILREESGRHIKRKIGLLAKFSTLCDEYAQRKGLQAATLRFSYGGRKIFPHDTPDSLGMDFTEIIEVIQLRAALPDTLCLRVRICTMNSSTSRWNKQPHSEESSTPMLTRGGSKKVR